MKFSVKKKSNNGPLNKEKLSFPDTNLYTWFTESNYDLNSEKTSLDSLQTCTLTIFDTDLSEAESGISFVTEPPQCKCPSKLINQEIQCSTLKRDISLDTADIKSQESSEDDFGVLESESSEETEIREIDYEANPWDERKLFQQLCNRKVWNETRDSLSKIRDMNILYKILQNQSSNTIDQLIKNAKSQPINELTDFGKEPFIDPKVELESEKILLNNFKEAKEVLPEYIPLNGATYKSMGNMKNSPGYLNKCVWTDGDECIKIIEVFPMQNKNASTGVKMDVFKPPLAKNMTYSQLFSKAQAPQKNLIKNTGNSRNYNKNTTTIYCKGDNLKKETLPNKPKQDIGRLSNLNSCPLLENPSKDMKSGKSDKKLIKTIDRFVNFKVSSESESTKIFRPQNSNKIRPNTCTEYDMIKFENYKRQKVDQGNYPSFIPIVLSTDKLLVKNVIEKSSLKNIKDKFTKKNVKDLRKSTNNNKNSNQIKPKIGNSQNANLEPAKKSSCILSVPRKNNEKNIKMKRFIDKLEVKESAKNPKKHVYLTPTKKDLPPNPKKSSPNKKDQKKKIEMDTTILKNRSSLLWKPKVKMSFVKNCDFMDLNDKMKIIVKPDFDAKNKLFLDPNRSSDFREDKNQLRGFRNESRVMRTHNTITNVIPTAHKSTECKQYVSFDSLRNKQINTCISNDENNFSKSVETQINIENKFSSSTNRSGNNLNKSKGSSISESRKEFPNESINNKENLKNDKVELSYKKSKYLNKSQHSNTCKSKKEFLNDLKNNESRNDKLKLSNQKPKLLKRKRITTYPIIRSNFRFISSKPHKIKYFYNEKRKKGSSTDVINVELTPDSKNLLEKLSGLLKSVHLLPKPSNIENLEKVDKFTSCVRQVSFTLPPQTMGEPAFLKKDCSTNVPTINDLKAVSGSILKDPRHSNETLVKTRQPELNTNVKPRLMSTITAKSKFYVRPLTADVLIKGERSYVYQGITPYGHHIKNEALAKKYITSRWFSYRALRSNDAQFAKRMMDLVHKKEGTLS